MQLVLEMEVPRCLLKLLPEDVLCTLFVHWLNLKDVVKVDTATCQRNVREHFLAVLTKCSLNTFPGAESNIDCGLRWLLKRNIPCRLESLDVTNVSDQYEESIEQCATMLTSLTNLEVYAIEGSTNGTTRWLELVAPSCRNLREIELYVSAEDVEWIRVLIANAPLLTTAWISFHNDVNISYPLLQDLAANKLLTVVHFGVHVDCAGIDVLMRNNTNLVQVHLDSCLSMTDDVFICILNLPNVSAIALGGNNSVRGDGALNITSTCITYFKLWDFSGLTTANQLRILQAFPRKDILDVRLSALQSVCRFFSRDHEDLLREFKRMNYYSVYGYQFAHGRLNES